MMFDLHAEQKTLLRTLFVIAASLFVPLFASSSALAQPTAVVPEHIIYPGQQISSDMVREVVVTNPNLRPGYARVIAEVDGFVTKKTLLPGRIIPVAMLREAYLIERGKTVPMIFSNSGMTITAQGVALQNGGLGEIIRVRNLDSGVIIAGTVMQDGTLRVMAK